MFMSTSIFMPGQERVLRLPRARKRRAGIYVGRFQIGIGGKDPLAGMAGGQKAQDIRDCDPHAPDARFAGHDERVHRDSLKLFHEVQIAQQTVDWRVSS